MSGSGNTCSVGTGLVKLKISSMLEVARIFTEIALTRAYSKLFGAISLLAWNRANSKHRGI